MKIDASGAADAKRKLFKMVEPQTVFRIGGIEMAESVLSILKFLSMSCTCTFSLGLAKRISNDRIGAQNRERNESVREGESKIRFNGIFTFARTKSSTLVRIL